MADPADRLTAAAANTNSVLFICPSHVLQRTFIRPFAEVRLVQDETKEIA
jgi:hypothetical protein